MMNKFVYSFFLFLLLTTILTCGTRTSKNKFEAKVDEVHELINAKNYQQMYDDSHTFLKKRQSNEEFVTLIKNTSEKYGEIKNVEVYKSRIERPKRQEDDSLKFYEYKVTAEKGKYIELVAIAEDTSKDAKLYAYEVFDYDIKE